MRKIILILSLYFILPQLSFTQISGNTANQDFSSDTLAIPISDISIRSAERLSDLIKILEEAQPGESTDQIVTELNLMVDSIRLEKKAFDKEKIDEWGKRRLQNLRLMWHNYEKLFIEWEDGLVEEIQELQKKNEQLSRYHDKWILTRDAALKENLPKVTTNSIYSVLKEIKRIENDLTKINKNYLTIQNKIVNQLKDIEAVLKTIDAALSSLKKSYWSIDEPPLWDTPLFIEDKKEKLSVGEAFQSDIKILSNFILNSVERLIYLALLFTLILLVIAYFKKKDIEHIIEATDELSLQVVKIIMKRSISAATMITFFFMILTSFSVPAIAREIITILITIPVLRILSGFVDTKLFKFYFFLIALFVIMQIGSHLSENLLVSHRYFLLVESVLGILVFFSFYKREELLMANSTTTGRKLISKLAPLAIIFMVASFLGNILGMSYLAENYAVGTVKSAVFLLMFYIIYLTIYGFISILIRKQQSLTFQALKKRTKIVEKQFMLMFGFIIAFLWIRSVLKDFYIDDIVAEGLLAIISHSWEIGSFTFSVSSILGFIVIIVITFFISRFISLILEEDIFARIKFPRGVAGAISMMSRYIIVGIGIIVALAVSGFDMSKFSLIVGALGVGIGFGLQNIINNFVSGLILGFERPIEAGDVIEVGPNSGTVRHIGVRASRIRAFDGTEVIIPNADLISKEVINWTLSDKLKRQEIFIKTAIDSNPHLVKEILEKVCIDHAYVLDDPRPLILYLGFSEFSLEFRMLFWTYADNGLSTKSDVGLKVYDELKNSGIKIPVQVRDINVSYPPEEETKRITKKPKKK